MSVWSNSVHWICLFLKQLLTASTGYRMPLNLMQICGRFVSQFACRLQSEYKNSDGQKLTKKLSTKTKFLVSSIV